MRVTLLNFSKRQWHPVRPIIASVSSGVVSIWAQNQVENWSAFAPDFKGELVVIFGRCVYEPCIKTFAILTELDENVEYEERESEFDLGDEDKSVTQNEREVEDDLEVIVDY